jgi:hypothetical protein
MANGDIAAGAGWPIVPSTALVKMGYDEINLTRDLAAGVTPVTRGGTGATNAAEAVANLGAVPANQVYDFTGSIFYKIPRYDGNGRLICATPALDNEAAPKAYVDTRLRAALNLITALTARVDELERPTPQDEDE